MQVPRELLEVLKDFADRRLWGQIQLEYQHGELIIIRKQETVKPHMGDGDARHSA